MTDVIAPASMLAKDKHFQTHVEWLRNISALMHKEGSLEKPWDGRVQGEAVKACIDNSRWVAFCPHCKNAEAVDPKEKVFFCFRCNMVDNEYQALPVEFPETKLMNEIIAVLQERPVLPGFGPTQYERICRTKPAITLEIDGRRFGLTRSWHYSQTVDDLRKEQDEPIKAWKKKKDEAK